MLTVRKRDTASISHTNSIIYIAPHLCNGRENLLQIETCIDFITKQFTMILHSFSYLLPDGKRSLAVFHSWTSPRLDPQC